jgi:hypothetical protein
MSEQVELGDFKKADLRKVLTSQHPVLVELIDDKIDEVYGEIARRIQENKECKKMNYTVGIDFNIAIDRAQADCKTKLKGSRPNIAGEMPGSTETFSGSPVLFDVDATDPDEKAIDGTAQQLDTDDSEDGIGE